MYASLNFHARLNTGVIKFVIETLLSSREFLTYCVQFECERVESQKWGSPYGLHPVKGFAWARGANGPVINRRDRGVQPTTYCRNNLPNVIDRGWPPLTRGLRANRQKFPDSFNFSLGA